VRQNPCCFYLAVAQGLAQPCTQPASLQVLQATLNLLLHCPKLNTTNTHPKEGPSKPCCCCGWEAPPPPHTFPKPAALVALLLQVLLLITLLVLIELLLLLLLCLLLLLLGCTPHQASLPASTPRLRGSKPAQGGSSRRGVRGVSTGQWQAGAA
jgi:hypothetical protein